MSEGPKLPTEARLGILRVNFPRPALHLIRKLIKPASHLRVSYGEVELWSLDRKVAEFDRVTPAGSTGPAADNT